MLMISDLSVIVTSSPVPSNPSTEFLEICLDSFQLIPGLKDCPIVFCLDGYTDTENKYETKFKSSVSTFGGHAYDAFMIIEKALEKNPKNLVEGIEQLKGVIGTYGEFNFSAKDHNGLSKDAFVMLKINGGNWALAE